MSRDALAAEARPDHPLTVAELVRELPGAPSVAGDGGVALHGVFHDSRRIGPGDLFVVRRGASFDGSAFVGDALARGASAILAGHDAQLALGEANVPVVRVDDVPTALAYASAAVYGHPAFALEIVGVTGTNGKTTTTHFVRAAIDGALGAPKCGIIGTVGHVYGGQSIDAEHTTPEADELARVMAVMKKRGASHLAMEVSSIALALSRVKAVRFRVAAFTNLTQDHLDFHGSMEAYGAAKMELFTTMGPGVAVVNVDDPFGEAIAASARCKVVRVRTKPWSAAKADADVAPEWVEVSPSAMRFSARVPGGRIEVATSVVGLHNLENILVALGIASALELDVERAAAAIATEPGAPGRLERCDGPGDDVVVVVDYAHTPDALARILQAMRDVLVSSATGPRDRRARVVCLFGCGGDRDLGKRRPMGKAVAEQADLAILTSDNPRTEKPELIAEPVEDGIRAGGLSPIGPEAAALGGRGYLVELDRATAIELAVRVALPGDIVVLAGKGHETYQIVGTTKRPFDDREHARRALALRSRGAF